MEKNIQQCMPVDTQPLTISSRKEKGQGDPLDIFFEMVTPGLFDLSIP